MGARIKKRRQVLGMTQSDLAVKLHVAKSTVANWERGHHFPLRYLGAIEHVLGVDLTVESPPIDRRVQEMIDGLSPAERDWVISRLTGQPLPPQPEPPEGRHVRRAG